MCQLGHLGRLARYNALYWEFLRFWWNLEVSEVLWPASFVVFVYQVVIQAKRLDRSVRVAMIHEAMAWEVAFGEVFTMLLIFYDGLGGGWHDFVI